MAGGELDNKTQITVGGRVSPVNGQYYSGISVELIQIKDNEEFVCGSGVTDSNGYYTITARVFNINGMGKLFTHVGNDCSSIIDFDEPSMQFTVTDDFETEGSPVPFRFDGILAVDFDDGEWEVYNNSTIWQISHDYASTGNYHVQVYGNVTEILNTCFLECSSLTSITLPENLIGLAVSCFWRCNNLTSISIPQSVTLMGDSVFGWTGLTRVDFNWETASEIIPYNNTWFYNTPSSLKLYIPAGTTSLYVAKGYPSSMLIEDGTPFDDITVTSTQDILSYADGDSTVLSAQLTNGGQAVSVSGESVTFEVRKQSDDSLVETLTDTTDNTGLASVEYFGKGVGDLNIKCQCRSVIETYSNIEDCSNAIIQEQSFSANGIQNITDNVPNLANVDFELEFDFKCSDTDVGLFLGDTTYKSTRQNRISMGKYGGVAFQSWVSTSSSMNNNGATLDGNYHNFKLVREGSNIKGYCDGVLIATQTPPFLNVTTWSIYAYSWKYLLYSIKNIKLKPL